MIYPMQRVEADGEASAPATASHGSGSYQLNSVPTEYRFYTEYFVKADTNKSIKSAGIDRRTTIKVYANAGEIILFGSSVANSQIDKDNNYTGSETGADIVITTPGGQKVVNDVLLPGASEGNGTPRPNGLGYIKNPTQEMNGPMVNHTDETHPENFYVPLQYPVTESGVYTFEFHSVTGFNPNSASSGYHPSPKKASDNWAQGNTSVAAWDVTVLGKKNATEWEVKEGRAWADYLALTTAGATVSGNVVKSDLNVHILSHDGYQYKVNFKEAAPYGFIFFANNTGFMSAVTDESNNTTYLPAYHSFYDSSNDLDGMSSSEKLYLHKPDEQDTSTLETYKIFFNAPNNDLNGVTYTRYGVSDTIKTAPATTVTIQDLLFTGVAGNVARTGHGGFFTFHASGEAMVTIRLDLRKAIYESELNGTMEPYNGSGIVEITVPAHETTLVHTDTDDVNSVYWDGRDTDGVVVPAGIYGNNNVVISTEIKRGELHFPVIDMEGLYGGLQVERLNGGDSDLATDKKYDIYYNNNPLAYGTIEGAGYSRKDSGPYFLLSDGTLSYKAYSDTVLAKYFPYGASSISTLKKDDKEYLSQKLFATSYAALDSTKKEIIDAEFNVEKATFHYEPVNSSTVKMKFNADVYEGGGNKAGIDTWTYYSSGVDSTIISFAVMDTVDRGVIKGQIFYDVLDGSGHPDSVYIPGAGDYLLSGVKVRLLDASGKPLVHKENLPSFDETGHFKYNADGSIVFDEKDVKYESITDSTGTYRFTSVPYSSTGETKYYVQVMLTDVQSEVMRYTCTTSGNVKNEFVSAGSDPFITAASIDTSLYGADGNTIIEALNADGSLDASKIYRHKYARNDEGETVFVGDAYKDNLDFAQSVSFSSSDIINPGDPVKVKEFKMIGYSSTVPTANIKNIKVKKDWGTDSHGNPTHQISDGIEVELWVWHDDKVAEVNTHELTRRTGALVDSQVLSSANGWSYTWKNLDDRLQYYVLEYYHAKKANGEAITYDNGEPRKVLIGGTMPIFGDPATVPDPKIYGFDAHIGAYPETIVVNGEVKIPIQQFGDGKTHSNALTDKEKLESIENNARQYDVSYTLTKEDADKTNVITLKNSQTYDDRAYYVWLNHEAKLPEMIALTYVETESGVRVKKSHAAALTRDTSKPLGDGSFAIKGLSISSVDSATDNSEGNATSSFRIKEDGKGYAFFTATNTASYKTGTGTRTYRVKYVVNKSDNSPVSVAVDETTGALIETESGSNKLVETLPAEYVVTSWYMTIHVYNVEPDGVIEYDPAGGPITLQDALAAGGKLKWTLTIDADNENSVKYTSNDIRTGGILANDTYRLPLYKHAEHPDMGTCADIVAIAYAGSFPVDDADISTLDFSDTFTTRYGDKSYDESGELISAGEDGKAVAEGSGGYVEINLNTLRASHINRTQDHANYAKVTFTPGMAGMGRAFGTGEDVFYYKLVVYSEDTTYTHTSYDEVDATEGVVMYSYFTMKPLYTLPPSIPPETPADPPAGAPDGNTEGQDTAGTKLGSTTPKTGDENNLMLWFSLIIVAAGLISAGTTKILKRD